MLALSLITLLCVSFLAFVYFEVERLKVELDLYKRLVDSLNDGQAQLNFRVQQLEIQGQKPQRMISAEVKEALYDKPTTIDIDKMVDDYANNEEFGKPLNCMIRAYRQGLKDAIGKVVSESAWSEEDEEMLDGIILRCEKYGHQEQINWLKSLKERIGG